MNNLSRILISLLGWWCCCAPAAVVSSSIPSVGEYWPEMASDLSLVTWTHATNSRAALQAALADDEINMIVADVVLGTVTSDTLNDTVTPIMAQPPANSSDLSLEMFISAVLRAVNQDGMKKGIKLNFEDIKTSKKSLRLLARRSDELNFPVWLNAEILQGPVGATAAPLPPQNFLPQCVEFLPEATLSLGWTTNYTFANDSDARYLNSHVKEMTRALQDNHVLQPVTFTVRAAFVEKSHDALSSLVHMPIVQAENFTLTVWSSSNDTVNIKSLVWLQETLGAKLVYFDLPEDQRQEFDQQRELIADTDGEAASVKSSGVESRQMLAAALLYLSLCFLYLNKQG